MYNRTQICMDLIEAIKNDNPLPIISHLNNYETLSVIPPNIIAVHIVVNEIIDQDKIVLFNAIQKEDPEFFQNLLLHKPNIQRVFYIPIISAIIRHEHTEIICCMLSNHVIRSIASDKVFISAVLSENYPIISTISALPHIKKNINPIDKNMQLKKEKFIIPGELIKILINEKKYKMLDYLTDNGKKLYDLDICKTLLIGSKFTEAKKYLLLLAEKYMQGYSDYEDKARALMDFILSTTDIHDVITTLFQYNFCSFAITHNEKIELLKFLSEFGAKVDDIDIIIRYIYNCSFSFNSDNDIKALIEQLRVFIAEDSHVNLSNILFLINLLKKEPKWVLDLLFYKTENKCTLIIDKIKNTENIPYDMFMLFLKYFTIEIDGTINNNYAITKLIERNNLQIMMLLIKTGIFSDDDIEDIKALCAKNKKERMLLSVEKWYAETKET